MSDNGPTTPGLRYAVKTARRAGVTRDLPYAPEDLQWVANSATLVYGTTDAVLVDTFTSIDQNAELVEWVRSFGRTLTDIYITHGHGDHFFGIGQLLEAFPTARAVRRRGTAAAARTQVEPAFVESFWQKLFPGQIPRPLASPEVSTGR
jgi:glyoxylase-like metal-dependent hydrolase (beta-lactamase superfamily II)